MTGYSTHKVKSAPFLVKVTHSKRRGHFTMPVQHYHEHYEIYYLLNGERNYFIQDRIYAIKKGDIVLIYKNVVHRTIDSSIPDHERLLVDFTDEALNAVSSKERALLLQAFDMNSPVIRLEPYEQIMVEHLLNKMLQEEQAKAPGYNICLRAYLLELLVLLVRLRGQKRKSLAETIEASDPLHQKISEIVQYINGHYSQELSLTTLSKTFYISPYYLSRLFKRVTGFNFVEYLNLIRVKEAQKLLQGTDMKIIEVAQRVGFGSVAHFGRTFKSITSLSPSDYRKTFKSTREPATEG
ncbi:AraC family transcriptional regulator [Caldicoprobacter faecalis]|uniref:AraC-like ligand binding domain-containing protein n=1 Tax=Caldicoprobacter faecalis TaxID=937334 RepID=A0A1I5X531_9FIRM|nr:AraC family transcriptional regulator [Caldicoprobacter faecalis]SFQ27048.1 AraC-like ligand binding domain-containing protein [Caldicoprobacter faecalis]